MEREEILLYKAIDKILWQEWDPIGLYGVIEARDEYYSYLPEVYRLTVEGADMQVIANYLFETETERMGLPGDMQRCRKVATMIISLK